MERTSIFGKRAVDNQRTPSSVDSSLRPGGFSSAILALNCDALGIERCARASLARMVDGGDAGPEGELA